MALSSRNVVVFGETGVGKSSVVNMILGRDEAKISDKADGCTFDSTVYPVEIDGARYNLYDTAGLNEESSGTVDGAKAVANLYSLVKSLSYAGGINLLVLVVRCSRLTETMQKNYKLFHHGFCESKVPIVIVVTGCENVEPKMDGWWEQNEERFKKADMNFDGYACVCTFKGRRITEGLYSNGEPFDESKGKINRLIHEHCSPDGWKKPPLEWFEQVLAILHRLLASWVSWSKIPALYEKLYQRLLKFLSASEAERIIDAVRNNEK